MSASPSTPAAATARVFRASKASGYKDFLTPHLHRKFLRAAGITLLGCYVEAILIGDKSSYFWSWAPFGRAGVRTLLLFISVLILFILRVSHLKFGQRTAVSPLALWTYIARSMILLRTLCFYFVSAWWFIEVYIWSASNSADLKWVKVGEENGRDRLNERPIILKSNAGPLALAMTMVHLLQDYDQIKIQRFPMLDEPKKPLSQRTAVQIMSSKLRSSLKTILWTASIATCTNLFLYAWFFRRFAWAWSLWIGRLIWDIPRSAKSPSVLPYHYTLLLRAWTSSFFLICLWELSNVAFSAWVCQPPVKYNRPLTTDSRDPNASLISGLRSRKSLTKISALWELSIISRAFEERRRSIFTEIDRPGAESTWKQILESCLSVIEAVDSRLEDARVPPPELTLTSHTDKDIKKIPKLSAPLRMDRILQASPKAKNRTEWAESEIGALAKSMGHNKGKAKHGSPGRLFLKSVALQIIPEQWEKNQSREIVSSIQSIASQSWFTSITTPFRQTFAARVQAKVFGTPRSEFPAILFSIYSISRLAVAGITEDTMGTVNQDIPLIMRTFGNAIGRIQKFIDESHVHWTDVRSTKGVDDSKRVEEVKFLIGYLRAALGHIINGYEGFARDMGIAPSELKAARIAAGQAQV